MKLKELIDTLNKLSPEFDDLEVYAKCGSSGVSYELGSSFKSEVSEYDDAGPLCELTVGKEYIRISIGS